MKKLILVSILLLSANAFAESIYMIGYGKDGATSQIFPGPNSLNEAAAVSAVFKKGDLSGANYDMRGNPSGMSVRFTEAGHAVRVLETGKIKVAVFEMTRGNISFQGAAAEALMNNLKVPTTTPSAGIILKQVANLRCSKDTHLNLPASCVFKDVAWLKLESKGK